jgi:ABC-type proline/glycine betaine transport system permease subunit
MYWTAFVASGASAGLVILYGLRIRAVVGTWQHLVQLASLGLGALLFGLALGFGVGIFTRRRNSLQGPPE